MAVYIFMREGSRKERFSLSDLTQKDNQGLKIVYRVTQEENFTS